MSLDVVVVSMALVNTSSASARDVNLFISSLTSRWIWWLTCVGVILTGEAWTPGGGGGWAVNWGGKKLGGIISFGHGYPPGCWEKWNVYIGRDILGGRIVGVFTFGGGDEEVRRRLISVTSSFTEVIK